MSNFKISPEVSDFKFHPECPLAFSVHGNKFDLRTINVEQAEYLLQQKFEFISKPEKKTKEK